MSGVYVLLFASLRIALNQLARHKVRSFLTLLGILIGVGGTLVVTTLTNLPPSVMWSAVAGAALLSVAVGLLFGLQPAWRAANVDPIQALRS